jgi:hypothetical protein
VVVKTHKGEIRRYKKYGRHCQKCIGCGYEEVKNDDRMNLCKMIIMCFDKNPAIVEKQWLKVTPKPVAEVVISRSNRYKNPWFPWKKIIQKYKKKAVFVGIPEEYKLFCKRLNNREIPHHKTKDLLELAEVIAGSQLFIGNQSAPYSIAEGLKVNCIQETSCRIPACIFPREGARYYMRQWYPTCQCKNPQCIGCSPIFA